jgi:flagellin-like hook-associated protein FlgL
MKQGNIDFTLLTESPGDPLTSNLIAGSGGTLQDLSDNLANPDAFFTSYTKRLTEQPDLDMDLLAGYVAGNGASMSALRTLEQDAELTTTQLEAAHGRINDVDVAAETTNLARASILQQASSSLLQTASANPERILLMLQQDK